MYERYFTASHVLASNAVRVTAELFNHQIAADTCNTAAVATFYKHTCSLIVHRDL